MMTEHSLLRTALPTVLLEMLEIDIRSRSIGLRFRVYETLKQYHSALSTKIDYWRNLS